MISTTDMKAAGASEFAISALVAIRNFNEEEVELLERCLEERRSVISILRGEKAKFVTLPITKEFRQDIPPIGFAKIMATAVPEEPNWILSLAYRTSEPRPLSLALVPVYGDKS